MSETLPPGEVHVWHAVLPDGWEPPLGVLSDSEQERVARFVQPASRDMKAFSLVVRRSVLARYAGVSPAALCFDQAEHGKPFLPDQTTLHFNVSDTDHTVIVAVSGDAELGVDIERRDRDMSHPGLHKHVLSPKETRCWQQLDEGQASAYLLHAWVAKEAYVKCLGKGLFTNMTAVTVLGEEPSCLQSPDPTLSLQWLSLRSDCLSALCVRGDIQAVSVREWVG